MRFQKTHEGDIPELKRLWKQAFGDTDAEIEGFFRDAFPGCMGFAARDEEHIAAMCFALPQEIVCADEALPAAYLYAVATEGSYRGRGLCRQLLEFAEKTLRKRGFACLMLVPADESLAAMYRKLGYEGPARGMRSVPAPAAVGHAEKIGAIEYAGLRETLLWDEPHVRYGKAWLEYEAQDAAFYALRLGAASGCAAAVRLPDGTVRVDELLPDVRFLPALQEALRAERYTLPEEPSAMCRWLTQPPAGWEKIYLGFDFA